MLINETVHHPSHLVVTYLMALEATMQNIFCLKMLFIRQTNIKLISFLTIVSGYLTSAIQRNSVDVCACAQRVHFKLKVLFKLRNGRVWLMESPTKLWKKLQILLVHPWLIFLIFQYRLKYFLMTWKLVKMHLYINQEIKMTWITIALFQFYPLWQEFLKRSYMDRYMNTLPQISY